MLVPTSIKQSTLLRYRFAVFSAAAVTLFSLLGLGVSLVQAGVVAVIATAGAVEVACQLTAPYPAPKVRIKVIVLILVVVVHLLDLGYLPFLVLPLVFASSLCTVWIARRITGPSLRFPRVRITY
jgi:hypothetical protein